MIVSKIIYCNNCTKTFKKMNKLLWWLILQVVKWVKVGKLMRVRWMSVRLISLFLYTKRFSVTVYRRNMLLFSHPIPSKFHLSKHFFIRIIFLWLMFQLLMESKVGKNSVSLFHWSEVIRKNKLVSLETGEEWMSLLREPEECSSSLVTLNAFQKILILVL